MVWFCISFRFIFFFNPDDYSIVRCAIDGSDVRLIVTPTFWIEDFALGMSTNSYFKLASGQYSTYYLSFIVSWHEYFWVLWRANGSTHFYINDVWGGQKTNDSIMMSLCNNYKDYSSIKRLSQWTNVSRVYEVDQSILTNISLNFMV